MLRSMNYRYSRHRGRRSGRPDLMLRARHGVVFAHGGSPHSFDGRKRRLPTKRLGNWSYQVSKKQGQDSQRVHEQADGGGKASVWESDTGDLDALGQCLDRSLDGGSP